MSNNVARPALVPMMAALNGVLLVVVAGALTGYWLFVLGPFILRGETSRAEVLTSAHAAILEAALQSGDLSRVRATLDQLVLLNDPETQQPFVRRVELARPDAELLWAESPGDATGVGVPVEVMLFSPSTFEVVGFLSVLYSGFFYEQAKANALRGLAVAIMAPLLFVVAGNMAAVYLLQGRIKESQDRAVAAAREYAAELERRVEERTAALEVANKELEAFSYSVSHDLRAPLRALQGFARILLDEYAAPLPPEAQRYITLLSQHGAQMGRLIDDLLQFSRLGRQALAWQTVDVGALVRETLATVDAGPEGRSVEIRLADLAPCAGDFALLRQVFVNLLSNALKFTQTRPHTLIEIGTAPEQALAGERVYFVRDNGVGFDMEYADKLFKVFERLHTEAAFPGTGVGLAIVRRIVERHGGRVWAEGRVDAGATFYFTLPAGKDAGDERVA